MARVVAKEATNPVPTKRPGQEETGFRLWGLGFWV